MNRCPCLFGCDPFGLTLRGGNLPIKCHSNLQYYKGRSCSNIFYGCFIPMITSLMPALMIALVQGGVLFSVWQHGSRLTYSEEPLHLSPAFSIARASAWGVPGFRLN